MVRHRNATPSRALFASLLLATSLIVAIAPRPTQASPQTAAVCVPPPVSAATPIDVPDAGFVPIVPTRIADTRIGIGVPIGVVDAGCVLQVPLVSAAPPVGATAVALTVTSDRASTVGYVTAYACGSQRTLTSNLNPQPGLPSPNLIIVPIDSTGAVCLFTEQPTDLIVDVTGWFVPDGDRLHEISPIRALDTRPGARPEAGTTVQVPIGGVVVPATAEAVAVTVTVTQASSDGFVTAYPCSDQRPPTSTNNVLAGRDRGASALLGLGTNGTLCIYTDIPTHLIVDVAGWFGPSSVGDEGSPLASLSATRIADTRNGPGQLGAFSPGEQRRYPLLDELPLGTTSVQLNITSTSASAAGFLTVHPCNDSRPEVSSVNYSPGPRSETTLVTMALGADGEVCVYSSAGTHVVIDLFAAFGTDSLLRSFVTDPPLDREPVAGQIDHTLRCPDGPEPISIDVTAAPGVRVAVDGGAPATHVTWTGNRNFDGLVEIDVTTPSGEGEQLWVRCLPPDFPDLAVDGQSPVPGWYTASFLPGPGGFSVGNYAFILDEYGVPVWYKRLPYVGVGLWTQGSDEIAYRRWTGGGFPIESPPNAIERHDLSGTFLGAIAVPGGGNTGWHELLTLGDGRHVVTEYRIELAAAQPCIRITDGGPASATAVVHSDIVEINAAGVEVWRWSSEAPGIAAAETINPICFDVDPNPAVTTWGLDLVHINSIDVFPDGDYLISGRHTNSLYRIDHGTQTVVWKLGGTSRAESLTLVGDGLGGPNASHDARVLADGNVTVHDNRSYATNSRRPRAAEYEIDEAGATATLVWSYTSPNLLSGTLGSVRRQPDGGTVIGWGATGQPWLQELDPDDETVMTISVPSSHTFYRVVKLPATTYDRTTLRSLAGGTAQPAP